MVCSTAIISECDKAPIVFDYSPREGPVVPDAIGALGLEALFQVTAPLPSELSSRAKAIPSLEEIKESLRDGRGQDLSESLIALRSEHWDPDAIAETLLQNEEVRQQFSEKEELVSILGDLKKLDDDLQKIGCSSLQQFIERLIPGVGERGEDIEEGWVEIPDTALSKRHQGWYEYFVSGGKSCYYYGKKLSEAKGVFSAVITMYFLLWNPQVIAIIKGLKGLKWLALALV